MSYRALGWSLVCSLAMGVPLTHASTFVVPPAPGTPIQDAVDAAAPGDTIRLTIGTYAEHVVIGKPLKLRGVRSRSTEPNSVTELQGGCAGGPVVTVASDGVQVRGILISLASGGGIAVANADHVKLIDVFAASNCSPVDAPLFDVQQSTRVKMNKLFAAGSNGSPGPAAIRIRDIPQQAGVRLTNSIAGGSQIGVLLQNVGILAVRVTGSDINLSDRGLVLETTSRALIAHNRLVNNTTAGIEIDATSSGNSIFSNTISGSANDVLDGGAGNCWRHNSYTTGSVPTCP